MKALLVSIFVFIVVMTLWLSSARHNTSSDDALPHDAGQPSLTVAVTRLEPAVFPVRIVASGNIMPWQEASIGTEANGLRLTEVLVNVGDAVRRGQRLASFATDAVTIELAQSRAVVAEAEAVLTEARANARRAQALEKNGALSAQQIQQYLSTELTAKARLDAAIAAEKFQRLRLLQTQVLAPDDGIISARTATVGAVVPAGQELFRLIRDGRLEWHADVAATDMIHLKPGQTVTVTPVGGAPVEGRLRMLSPMIDTRTRNGMAFVDLPPDTDLYAGMFARGTIDLGAHEQMSLPESALLRRDGFSHVMRIGSDARIIQTKIITGQQKGDRVAIISGLTAEDVVVASGVAFLGHGDLVRITESPEFRAGDFLP